MRGRIGFGFVGVLVVVALALPAHGEEVVRIATLAPQGSSWMNLFNEWSRLAAARSGNQLRLRFYAGGIMGDERDMVRKIRIRQIDGAAITIVGLGVIHRPVLVFATPGVFESYRELDHARDQLRTELEQGFHGAGFVLLGWGDTGMIRPFSNAPVRTPADLRRTRPWLWSDDPVVQAFYEEATIPGVRVGVPEVYPALQTRMIDAFLSSPLAALSLQWFSRVRYMTNLLFSVGIGATVVSRERFERLPPALRETLRGTGREIHERLVRQIRADDDAALRTLRARGLTVVEVPAEARAEWATTLQRSRERLSGTVYPRELLARVERLAAEARARR